MPFLITILEIIFPTKCLSCGRHGIDLCLDCLAASPVAERENKEWIYSLYDYRHPPIKKALWLLKYNGRTRLAKIFAEALYGQIIEELSERSQMENFINVLLIPIPLSRARYRERGYNQAELIARELVKIDQDKKNISENFRLENNILIKPKETEHQARIKNRAERMKNILQSFAVPDTHLEKIKGKNIILIDDITTTGATLTEARKILKQAGARKIIAFTVAH